VVDRLDRDRVRAAARPRRARDLGDARRRPLRLPSVRRRRAAARLRARPRALRCAHDRARRGDARRDRRGRDRDGATARRAPIWRDDPTFWQNAVAAVPDEGYAHGKLALALYERGELAAAEAEYRAALAGRINPPERAIVENNLGYLLLREKRWAEAEPLFRSAIVPGPRFSGPYRGLAESLLARATDDAPVPAEIRPMLERALEVDPADARAALLLGRLSIVEGKRDEGVRWLSHAARVAPESTSAADARATLARLGVQ
jgi:tetratricopeptide (TPR) repeat protein